MDASKDKIGQTYNNLSILSTIPSYRDIDIQNNITPQTKKDMPRLAFNKYSGKRCVAKCNCGNTIEWLLTDIVNGRKKYCGLPICTVGKKSFKVDQPKNDQERTIHSRWENMHQRCYNPKHHSYKVYGGTGVVVDDEWNRTNPLGRKNYTEWYLNELEKPDVKLMLEPTVDRIDSTKGYSSSNCRLATKSMQSANQGMVDRTKMKSKYKFVSPFYSKHNDKPLLGYKVSIKYEYVEYKILINIRMVPINAELETLICTHYLKWKNGLVYTTVQPIPFKVYICTPEETRQHAKHIVILKKNIHVDCVEYKHRYVYGLAPYNKNIGLRVVKWLDGDKWSYTTIAMPIDILKTFAITQPPDNEWYI